MAAQVDPDVLTDLKNFGVSDATACFNCGNCTALCELSSETVPFPRKTIRYLQLGLRDKLAQSPEPWLCHYCADCSKTCPRQANPGEVMMGLRRYLTSVYEPTGIARLFYRSNFFASVLTIVVALFLGTFLIMSGPAHTGQASPVSRWLFNLIDYHMIEYVGIAISILIAVSMIGGLKRIITTFKSANSSDDEANGADPNKMHRYLEAGRKVLKDIFLLSRYHSCDAEPDETAWYLKPWLLHGAIMWGFMGLALATLMDIPILGLKDPNAGTWLPSRLLGIAAGLSLMYGTSVVLYKRIKKTDKYVENSQFSDWLFLLMLWGLGLTGFWLTLAVTIFNSNQFHEVILLIHTVMAMELLLLFAFSKFAHVAYRPIALFFYYLRSEQH